MHLRVIRGYRLRAKVSDLIFQATGGHPTDYNYPAYAFEYSKSCKELLAVLWGRRIVLPGY
jgi:hypothetical protein